MNKGKSGWWWLRAAGLTVLTVWLVQTLLVTTCVIPSSGMENSLYQGERILVNKWSYGLRLPFCSLFGYHRLASSRAEKGDILLFNNPHPQQVEKGIEWRELFISRCIGTPGDTLMLDADLNCVGGEVLSPDAKSLYAYPVSSEDLMLTVLSVLGIKGNTLAGYTSDGGYIRSFSQYEYYLISQKLEGRIPLVPLDEKNRTEVHPYVIPAKGVPVKVYPWNVTLLCNTIVAHEHQPAEILRDTLYVKGKPVETYTFSKDYYWVASNDPVNICDSRLFGFVPEDHLIGKAWRIWYSSRKGRFWQRVQ